MRVFPMALAAALAVVIVIDGGGVVGTTGVARAAPADYDPGSTAWNGLSELSRLAKNAGVTIEPRDELDWESLEPGDTLFVLYPTAPLDPGHVLTFVRGGGRLLIADDFGRSDEALVRLGITRKPEQAVRAARYHEQNPSLPVALATGEHELTANAGELVTNHPGVFSGGGGARVLYRFGEGEAVVIAGEEGRGRFVALSDPSVLINAMLAFGGNLAFATNLVAWLRQPPEILAGTADGFDPFDDDDIDAGPRFGRIILLTREFAVSGVPRPPRADDPLTAANDDVASIDEWLAEKNDYLASEAALRAGAAMAAAFLVLLGVLLLPRTRPGTIDPKFAAAGDVERAGVEKVVSGADAGKPAALGAAAALLRDTVERRLQALTGLSYPLNTQPHLVVAAVQRTRPAAAAQLPALLPRLRRAPGPGSELFGWSIPRREFERLHDDVKAFLRALDAPRTERRD